MPIVSSSVIEDAVQIDGRRFITERHVDHLSVAHLVAYLGNADDDAQGRLAASAVRVAERLADAEMAQNIAFIMVGDYAKVTSQHVTMADIRTTLRALYATGQGEVIGRIAGFLLTLTDANLRAIFNMTQSEVNQLKVRLQAKVDALNTALTLVGE